MPLQLPKTLGGVILPVGFAEAAPPPQSYAITEQNGDGGINGVVWEPHVWNVHY